MGVHGLMTEILKNRATCAELEYLGEAAQGEDGIKLICDFSAVQLYLMSKFWRSAFMNTKNDLLRILGGEYKLIDEYFTNFVEVLRSLSIELVMVVDGDKGSSQQGASAKIATWGGRHTDRKKLVDKLLGVCEGRREMRHFDWKDFIQPVLLEVQVLETLRRCECEIIQCSVGEADIEIARCYRKKSKESKAYILCNDSDIAIFPDSKFIPLNTKKELDFFDMKNGLKLGESNPFPDKPRRLECGVVSSKKVSKLLEFSDQSLLVELSIIMGNDFTGPMIDKSLYKDLCLRHEIWDCAKWVSKHKEVENDKIMKAKMDQDENLRHAVSFLRQFYSIPEPEEQSLQGALSCFFRKEIVGGRYPADLMAMHQQFYWKRVMLEDCRQGGMSVEDALAPLRSYIYRMVLEKGENDVMEYGHMTGDPTEPKEEQATTDVKITEQMDRVNWKSPNVSTNRTLFADIMRHQEPGYPINFFDDDYGGECDGFLYICLRYLLRRCTGGYLGIHKKEFLAVFASMFAQVDQEWYQSLAIIPSARCVTLASLIQDIYRHAYWYLGKMLCLTHLFPKPKDVFSGAVFTAFYMVLVKRKTVIKKKWLDPVDASRVEEEYGAILDEEKRRRAFSDMCQDIY